MCMGEHKAGSPLVHVVLGIYNAIRYANFSVDETNALNPDAAKWARVEMDAGIFPTDPRLLMELSLGETA
jgi:hypothetical protein